MGADVVINHCGDEVRADKVARKALALGRRAMAVDADLADPDAAKRMFETVAETFGRLDVLVLNGVLEAGMPFSYAIQVNHDAQMLAVDLVVPLMPAGGRIGFVTSHAAHFYGERDGMPEYEAAAAARKAGEDAVRARIAEFNAHGILRSEERRVGKECRSRWS